MRLNEDEHKQLLMALGETYSTNESMMTLSSLMDAEQWSQRFQDLKSTICRIEVAQGRPLGTGFLVGPDLVMTNHHVMEHFISGLISPAKALFRFRYKVSSKDTIDSSGTLYSLALQKEWLLAWSHKDELDYAILRIAAKHGEAFVPAQERVWLQVSDRHFMPSQIVMLIQHPQGNTQHVSLGTVSTENQERKRVYYNASTLKGSSGSPCFSDDGDLVALHQGNNSQEKGEGVLENKGIPCHAIRDHLQAQGLLSLLDHTAYTRSTLAEKQHIIRTVQHHLSQVKNKLGYVQTLLLQEELYTEHYQVIIACIRESHSTFRAAIQYIYDSTHFTTYYYTPGNFMKSFTDSVDKTIAYVQSNSGRKKARGEMQARVSSLQKKLKDVDDWIVSPATLSDMSLVVSVQEEGKQDHV